MYHFFRLARRFKLDVADVSQVSLDQVLGGGQRLNRRLADREIDPHPRRSRRAEHFAEVRGLDLLVAFDTHLLEEIADLIAQFFERE